MILGMRWYHRSSSPRGPLPKKQQNELEMASALLLPYSCLATFKLLLCSFLASAQLLPSSCPAPASDLLLPSFSPAPGPTQCPPQFGSLHHHRNLTTFFGTARAAFYGIITKWLETDGTTNGRTMPLNEIVERIKKD